MTRLALALLLCAGCTHTASATASGSAQVDLVRLAQRERVSQRDRTVLPSVDTGHGVLILPEGSATLPGGVRVHVPKGAPPARVEFDSARNAQGEVRHVAESEHATQQAQGEVKTQAQMQSASATKVGGFPWRLVLLALLLAAGAVALWRFRARLPAPIRALIGG